MLIHTTPRSPPALSIHSLAQSFPFTTRFTITRPLCSPTLAYSLALMNSPLQSTILSCIIDRIEHAVPASTAQPHPSHPNIPSPSKCTKAHPQRLITSHASDVLRVRSQCPAHLKTCLKCTLITSSPPPVCTQATARCLSPPMHLTCPEYTSSASSLPMCPFAHLQPVRTVLCVQSTVHQSLFLLSLPHASKYTSSTQTTIHALSPPMCLMCPGPEYAPNVSLPVCPLPICTVSSVQTKIGQGVSAITPECLKITTYARTSHMAPSDATGYR